ncbi:hypothetical protein E4U21_005346 [Claviceps maximensis]|nr:hypothetical protein E4U21_005346 [Claviceps maximensis]
MSQIAVESWAWISQILLRGSPKKLKVDDYLMAVIMVTDTILVVVINIISTTNTNLIDPNNPTSLSPKDIQERDMTLKSNLVVKLVAGYTALGFVLMEVLYMGVWCRPFDQYWTVPPRSTQFFLQSKLALKRKFILTGVFALGVFTILSAILNKFHSFTNPFGSEWIFWYIRESSTAIIVTNLPLTWTVFRRLFNLSSFSSSEHSSKMRAAKLGPGSLYHTTHSRTQTRSYIKQGDANGDDVNCSEEHIAQSYGISLKIYQRHDVHISSERAPQRKRSKGSIETLPDAFATTTVIKGGQPSSFFQATDTVHTVSADTSSADSSYPVVNAASGV